MFSDRIYELYARWEAANEGGLAFDPAKHCSTPEERAELDRLIAEMSPARSSADQPSLPADTGRYRFTRFLARGGMGEVYVGEDTLLQRTVAIKVLRQRLGVSSARFQDEALLVAKLSHPGIVPVYDFGELADGRPFFVMKLVEGKTLEEVLGDSNAQSPHLPRWLQFFEQICQAVAYAHSQNPPLLHRDLKPSNVMIGAYGEVLVMDWGIARVVAEASQVARSGDQSADLPISASADSTVDENRPLDPPEETATGVAKGTVAYMAPEQARGERDRIGPHSDVFALGGILCRMLTGKPTFAGDDGWSRAVAGELGEAFGRLDRCGADAGLIAVAQRCLAPGLEVRFQNAAAVSAAIHTHLDSVQQRLQQAELDRARAETKAREERRRQKLVVVLAASVLTFLIAVGFGARYADQQRSERQRVESAQRQQAIQLAQSTLAQLPQLWQKYLWEPADHSLAEAMDTLGASGDPELKQKLDSAREDTQFLAGLDRIQLDLTDLDMNEKGWERTGRQFERLFQTRQIDVRNNEEQLIVERIRSDPLREEIVAAIDAWCAIEADGDRLGKLRRISAGVTEQNWRLLLERPHPDRQTLKQVAKKLEEEDASAAIYYYVGSELEKLEAGGIAVLEQGRRKYPSDFWMHVWLGALYHARRDGKDDLAEACFHAALVLRPNNAMLHSHLGNVLAGQGKRQLAIFEYERAFAFDSSCAHAHYNLGVLYHDSKNFGRAEEHVRRACELEPDYWPFLETLGRIRFAQKDYAGAVEAYQTAISRAQQKGQFQVSHYLAQAYWAMGKEQEAIKLWTEVTRWNPNHAQAQLKLGLGLLHYERFVEALPHLRTAAILDAKDATAHRSIAKTELRLNRPSEARDAIHKALAIDADNAEGQMISGLCEVQLGDFAAAVSAFEKCVALDSTSARGHANLGLALRDYGDLPPARQSFKRAAEIEPSLPGIQARLREVHKLITLDERVAGQGGKNATALTTNECLELARLYATPHRREYAAALNLFATALDKDPSLAKEGGFDAVIAAIQFASGNDVKSHVVDSETWGFLHFRARKQLSSLFNLAREAVAQDSPEARDAVRSALARWKYDPALKECREAPWLEAMPDVDRGAWRVLWAEINRLYLEVNQ